MTSPGKLSSAIVDFVAPLRLWHGLRPPPMVGFVGESPAGRLPGQPCARLSAQLRVLSTRELQEGRERGAPLARRFKQSVFFGHPQRRLVQSERRYGAEPRLHGWFLQGIFNGEKNNF